MVGGEGGGGEGAEAKGGGDGEEKGEAKDNEKEQHVPLAKLIDSLAENEANMTESLFYQHFPAHVNEMRYAATSGLVREDPRLASGVGGVTWDLLKQPFMTVLSQPGGRSFANEPVVLFEGYKHVVSVDLKRETVLNC